MKKNTTDGTNKQKTTKGAELDRSSEEYKKLAAKFDTQFGSKIDVKFLEDMSRRLDNKFQVLVDFTRESEKSNCDILLFKNVQWSCKLIETSKGLS